MSSYWNVLPWVVVALVMGGGLWFSWDMRSILKSGQRKARLSIDGRWKELDDYFLRAERTLRPFVWLHHRYLLPGNLETQFALFLYKQGRLEEALVKVDQALRRIRNKPGIFRSYHAKPTFTTLCGALRTRTLILTGLGRYDEARGAAAELQKITTAGPRANSSLALLELNCGHLEQALAEAQAMAPEAPQYDAMRGVIAMVYCYRREFRSALEALSYEPAGASKFFSQPGLTALTQTPEGVDLIALKQQQLARTFPPARWVMLARVYVAMEDFEKADRALDEAAKSLGPEPGLQLSYARQRACSLAGQGKSQEAQAYIERMRALVREAPSRSRIWETHVATGRAYQYLGRYHEALTEFTEAERLELHPIEKHTTAFWMARTHEALGEQSEATAYYQRVATDPIATWMREEARTALARLKA